eukprot:4800039-Prorocentrum_lima.AAC.1
MANQDAGKSRFSLLSLKPDDGGPLEPWAVRANHGHSHPMPWPSMYTVLSLDMAVGLKLKL